jgi:hypothetical protein
MEKKFTLILYKNCKTNPQHLSSLRLFAILSKLLTTVTDRAVEWLKMVKHQPRKYKALISNPPAEIKKP